MLNSMARFLTRGDQVNKSISSNGAVVFWSARSIHRDVATAAFDAEGMGHLIPKVDHYAALKKAAVAIVDACGVRAGGKVDYYSLASDRNKVGVEVRRVVKGVDANDMPFLFSLGVVRDSESDPWRVAVRKVDSGLCPEIAAHKAEVEDAATAVWTDACTYLTANDLTNAVTSLVRKLRGFLLRDGGVVWYVPKDTLDPFTRIATALAPHGPSMVSATFRPDVDDALTQHVCSELVTRSEEEFQSLIDEAADLRRRGAKARSNGQKSRLERLIEAEATLTHNKALLGSTFARLAKMAQAAKEAIGAEALTAMRDSA